MIRKSKIAITLFASLVIVAGVSADERDEDPDFVGSDRPTVPADAIPENAVIGSLVFERQDVFDLSNPKEDNWLYALANRWHFVTRESLIRRQILIEEGEPFSQRLVEESGRILRRNSFLFDAIVRPVAVDSGTMSAPQLKA